MIRTKRETVQSNGKNRRWFTYSLNLVTRVGWYTDAGREGKRRKTDQ